MSGPEWLYLCCAGMVSGLNGLLVWVNQRREQSYIPKDKWPLYRPRYSLNLLLLFVLPLLLFLFTFSLSGFIKVYGAVMLILGLYYGLLLLLRPVYRKKLRAESCAFLWVLIWILFYFRILSLKGNVAPRWYISLPLREPSTTVAQWVFSLWLLGFLGVALWSILSHCRYRRWLLVDARPLQEKMPLAAFRKQRKIANFHWEDLPLLVSAKTATPVSIGLFWKTTCIVLPEKQYTEEELDLIFRHELVHICRRDSFVKLQMVLCCALMWFHPLVWLAMRACADDLELSCDELALFGYPPQVRRTYADLLLRTSASQKGFTSCLSASAKALRQRLHSVINPGKRYTAGILIAVLSLVLMLSFMFIGIRLQPVQAEHLFFKNEDLGHYEITDTILSISTDPSEGGECVNDQALLAYIGGLSLRWISGPYDVYKEDHIQITAATEGKTYIFTFGKTHLKVLTITYANTGSRSMKTEYYEVSSRQDWDFIRSCLDEA